VNHRTLVKFSGQPSISSVNFSPFTSADFLTASDIRPVPRLKLQPNNLGGTAKKITTSTYRKYVAPTQERKIKQATKCKTSRLSSKALLGPSRRRKRKDCRYPTPSETPSDSGTYIADTFADDSTEEKEKRR